TGVDVCEFTPDPGVQREPIVLFVGRLVPQKGCDLLLRAMRTVQQRVPEARLIVIGDGPERGRLERIAAASMSGVEFLGSQPHWVVKQWLNRAHVFSVPSVTTESGRTEGFGMVFVEAQAMRVP